MNHSHHSDYPVSRYLWLLSFHPDKSQDSISYLTSSPILHFPYFLRYCSLPILPVDIMYSEILKVLSESINVWTRFYHFHFSSFRDNNLRFNLTCFDLQLDACDYNHLYIGANTGCVVHSLRSGGKPTPQFYIPNVGE